MAADVALVLVVSAAIFAFAFRAGGAPERIGALIVGFNICVDLLAATVLGQWDFSTFSSSRLLIDLLEFGLLLALAYRANRVWPIFSAAAQLVAVGGSLAVWKSGGGMQVAYWAVTQLPLLGQLAALAAGTLFHRRREALIGPYRDWRLRHAPAS